MSATLDDKASSLEPQILDVTQAKRPPDSPRRCFICLTDEDPSDPAGTWVDPCPCTLEAHQDCMLSWVTDCERTNKPLKCPVCKAEIELEGSWDLIVALNDAIYSRFTRTSPYILLTGVSMGVQFSLQMYGVLALWSFAGKDSMMRFILGPEMVIDVRNSGGVRFIRERIWGALVTMNVAPTLLFGQLLPNLSNKVFLPTASLYGMYKVIHDDAFLTWPPSPQLAIAVFPYIRSVYYSVWREFVLPHEVRLNRQILGLPPLEETNDAQQGVNQARPARQNGDGGFAGLLQGILDALDPDDEDEGDGQNNRPDENRDGGQGHAELMMELRIEEVQAGEGQDDLAQAGGIQIEFNAGEPREQEERGDDGHQDGARRRPRGLAAPGEGAGAQNQDQHEAPQAPPARRVGLGGLLSSISNNVVSALILPGISYAMGEVLRLALPKRWTTFAGSRNPWSIQAAVGGRPGLLQQQWGRSLVGGCLYVVLKDIIRVYAKSRRVAAMGKRRVKNVDRKRRGKYD